MGMISQEPRVKKRCMKIWCHTTSSRFSINHHIIGETTVSGALVWHDYHMPIVMLEACTDIGENNINDNTETASHPPTERRNTSREEKCFFRQYPISDPSHHSG